MHVHMYNVQVSQCCYTVSLAAICWSDSRSGSLLNTLHFRLCYTCMYVCVLHIIYIYIKSTEELNKMLDTIK